VSLEKEEGEMQRISTAVRLTIQNALLDELLGRRSSLDLMLEVVL
jgi:predicted nucleic acid-binding protein